MGIVYKAWHLRLQRPVALKMLLAGAYANRAELERFQREAPPLELTDVNLVLRNGAWRHRIRLDATPPEGWGERFSVRGEFRPAAGTLEIQLATMSRDGDESSPGVAPGLRDPFGHVWAFNAPLAKT